MIIGIINDKTNQIYIKLKEENGKNIVSFDKVNNEGITHLDKEEAINVINKFLNINKTFFENKDGYDIYIDENKYKRYYKDGKEDFIMFYKNNGVDVTAYNTRGFVKPLSKLFAFVVSGITFAAMISDTGSRLFDQYIQGDTSNIVYSFDVNSDYFKPVTLEALSKYIESSNGVSDYEKKLIYNEEYFNFLLQNLEDNRKLYDFNNNFKNITIEKYDAVGPGGYYDFKNILHIGKDTYESEFDFSNVTTHEFIHLTQECYFGYRYIAEALAEFMSSEFYGVPLDGYAEEVKRVKILMEIIGPRAIFNSTYSYDKTLFENSVKKYLEDEKATELLNLLYSCDFYEYEKEIKINERIDELLKEMIENKYKITGDEVEYMANSRFYEQVLAGKDSERIYFNTNNPAFYNSYPLMHEVETSVPTRLANSIEKFIETVGMPEKLEVSSIEFRTNDIKEYFNNPEWFDLIKGIKEINNSGADSKYIRQADGTYIKFDAVKNEFGGFSYKKIDTKKYTIFEVLDSFDSEKPLRINFEKTILPWTTAKKLSNCIISGKLKIKEEVYDFLGTVDNTCSISKKSNIVPYQYDATTEYNNVGYDENLINSKGIPASIHDINLLYTKEQFIKLLNMPEFKKLLQNNDVFLENGKDNYKIAYSRNEDGTYSKSTIVRDENHRLQSMKDDKAYNISDVLEEFDTNSFIKVCFVAATYSWDTFRNLPYLIEGQFNGTLIINENLSIKYDGNNIIFNEKCDLVLSSIYDKFGAMLPSLDEVNDFETHNVR